MKLRVFAMIWSIGVLSAGCQSQGAEGTALSLQRNADDSRRTQHDDMEMMAGSGAEADEPAEDEANAREAAEPADDADASVQDLIDQEMGWSDDSGLCGNGEIDEGELCDYAILEGEGACPESCDPKPGCPEETLIIRGCMTRCMQHDEPSEACLAAE